MPTLEDLAPRIDALEARLGPVGDLAIGRLAYTIGSMRGTIAALRRLRASLPWPLRIALNSSVERIIAEIDQQTHDVARALASLGH